MATNEGKKRLRILTDFQHTHEGDVSPTRYHKDEIVLEHPLVAKYFCAASWAQDLSSQGRFPTGEPNNGEAFLDLKPFDIPEGTTFALENDAGDVIRESIERYAGKTHDSMGVVPIDAARFAVETLLQVVRARLETAFNLARTNDRLHAQVNELSAAAASAQRAQQAALELASTYKTEIEQLQAQGLLLKKYGENLQRSVRRLKGAKPAKKKASR